MGLIIIISLPANRNRVVLEAEAEAESVIYLLNKFPFKYFMYLGIF